MRRRSPSARRSATSAACESWSVDATTANGPPAAARLATASASTGAMRSSEGGSEKSHGTLAWSAEASVLPGLSSRKWLLSAICTARCVVVPSTPPMTAHAAGRRRDA